MYEYNFDTMERFSNNKSIFHCSLQKMLNVGKYLLWYYYVRCLQVLTKIHMHPAGD